ncbi:hypothetical protein [Paenibacillus sp. DCT19]|uniref:hypothetical protein n=1 Tax=Paenibacillus sp. DCT19 TaxID=2211212 RepID=UPI0020C4B4F8|nr:hypothetical protein [Paenibacillus sp. DCT19]
MKLNLVLIDNRLVIDMNVNDVIGFKADGYTGLPERFDLDVMGEADVIGTVELSEEQVTKIKAEYKSGGKCDWCGEVVAELSHPHFNDFAIGKKMCRTCWDHDRDVYKGSCGDDIGDFKPVGRKNSHEY